MESTNQGEKEFLQYDNGLLRSEHVLFYPAQLAILAVVVSLWIKKPSPDSKNSLPPSKANRRDALLGKVESYMSLGK